MDDIDSTTINDKLKTLEKYTMKAPKKHNIMLVG